MNLRQLTISLTLLLLTANVLGLFFVTAHHRHDEGCPFMSSEMVMCAVSAIDVVSRWQNSFVAIGSEFLVVLSSLLLLVYVTYLRPPDRYTLALSGRTYKTPHPTLIQEFFAQGILNPKAP